MFNSKKLVGTELLVNVSGSKLRLVVDRGSLFRTKKVYVKLSSISPLCSVFWIE